MPIKLGKVQSLYTLNNQFLFCIAHMIGYGTKKKRTPNT